MVTHGKTNIGSLSRRQSLQVAFAAAAVGTLASPSSVFGAVNLNDSNLVYRKLRYRADEGLVFWWIKARKFGQTGTRIDPLFDMQVGSLVRLKNLPNGGYSAISLELVFYTDIATGAFMREWKNPYTGATVPMHHAPLGPTTTEHTPSGSPIRPTEIGGSRLEATSINLPPVVEAGDVWVKHESTAAVFPRDGKGEPFRVNDWSTYHAPLRDVADAAQPFVSSTVAFQEVTSWSRWMNMADKPGNQTASGMGRKVKSYAEMPATWRKLVEEHDPDVAKDPLAVLDRPSAKFEN
jgi:hypothetical protein